MYLAVPITDQEKYIQTKYGLNLDIPADCLPCGLKEATLNIAVYYDPTFSSGLYHFELGSCFQPLKNPITLYMEHCIMGDCKKHLSFFRSSDGKMFTRCEGGTFEGMIGRLDRSTFSWYFIQCVMDTFFCRNISYAYIMYLKHYQHCNRFEMMFTRNYKSVVEVSHYTACPIL